MRLSHKFIATAILLGALAVPQTYAHAQTLEGLRNDVLVRSHSALVAESAHTRTPKEIREREEERARILYRRQFQRRTSRHGHVDTSTFQRDLPSWYKTTLLEWRGMVLVRPAMRAYYDASMDVGHYIGGAGWRSHSTQMGMNTSLAAPAGYSYHEVGLAADIFGLSGEEQQALEHEGFNQLASEYWHYSWRVYG